jgi:acetyl/propionyl-CoA carboxylase alpha subunit
VTRTRVHMYMHLPDYARNHTNTDMEKFLILVDEHAHMQLTRKQGQGKLLTSIYREKCLYEHAHLQHDHVQQAEEADALRASVADWQRRLSSLECEREEVVGKLSEEVRSLQIEIAQHKKRSESLEQQGRERGASSSTNLLLPPVPGYVPCAQV